MRFSTHLFTPHVFIINFLPWLHLNPHDSQWWDCLLTAQFIGFHITNITQLPLPLFPVHWDNEFQHLESNFHLGRSRLQLMIQFKTGFVVGWESQNRMDHYPINGKETKQVWETHWPQKGTWMATRCEILRCSTNFTSPKKWKTNTRKMSSETSILKLNDW